MMNIESMDESANFIIKCTAYFTIIFKTGGLQRNKTFKIQNLHTFSRPK